MNPAEGWREARDQLDVLADETPQHAIHLLHHLVELHRLELDHLPPAERQQLAGEPRRALGGAADLLEILAALVVGLEARQHELGEAEDGGGEIVEVVGDAASESTEGLHLLRVAELLLAAAQRVAGAAQL